MMISPGFFLLFFFQNFNSSFCYWGKKGQKSLKMTKNYVCGAPYLRKHRSYDFYLWYTYVR